MKGCGCGAGSAGCTGGKALGVAVLVSKQCSDRVRQTLKGLVSSLAIVVLEKEGEEAAARESVGGRAHKIACG